MKKLIGALAVSAHIAAPAASSAQDLGRDKEVWTWDGKVSSGNWFRLSSVTGPVSIEPSNDGQVHVRAEKEVNRGSVTDVAFQVIQSGGDVRICALWRRDYCDEDGMHSRVQRAGAKQGVGGDQVIEPVALHRPERLRRQG